MSKFTNLRRPAMLVAVACMLASVCLLPSQDVAPPVVTVPAESSNSSTVPVAAPDDPDATESQVPTVTNEAPPTQRNVLLAVSGLRQQACPVLAAVFLNADGFPRVESASSTVRYEPKEAADHVEFELQLPVQGTAAIAVFQDLDSNGVLTKNALGLPIEPYGFSRNARATFGPPAFSAAELELENTPEKLEIQIR